MQRTEWSNFALISCLLLTMLWLRHKAQVVIIMFGVNRVQVPHEHRISIPLVLEILRVLLHVVYAWVDLLEVAESMLLLLKVQDYLHIVLRQLVVLSHAFIHLVQKFVKHGLGLLLDQL